MNSVRNESKCDWIILNKTNYTILPLRTWGAAMKSFHIGPMPWLSKQRGCMQWQLVLFCPCGMVPIILYSWMNVWLHLMSKNQSVAAHEIIREAYSPKK